MSRALTTIDEAAEALADAIQSGEPLSPDTALRLRACGLPEAIDSALDFAPGPGKRRPETTALLARRVDLLRQVARFYPTGSARARAEAISADWKNYEATAWPRDRKSDACPQRHFGKPQGIYFALMRSTFRPAPPNRSGRFWGTNPANPSPQTARW